MKVYVVEALRFGDREKHSYVVGVYTKKYAAQKAAEIEEAWRGGNKYYCEISVFEANNKHPEDKLKWFRDTDPARHR